MAKSAFPRISKIFGPPSTGVRIASDTGIVRTSWMAGTARQRRDFVHLPMTASLTWQLTAAELKPFVEWMDTYGWSMFEVEMESNLIDPAGHPGPHQLSWHRVRCIGPLSINSVSPYVYTVAMTVEMAAGVAAYFEDDCQSWLIGVHPGHILDGHQVPHDLGLVGAHPGHVLDGHQVPHDLGLLIVHPGHFLVGGPSDHDLGLVGLHP
jgi:hypothetical protein